MLPLVHILRSDQTVFTLKEIALLLRETNITLLKRRIHYLVTTGQMYFLRKGLYAKTLPYDPLEAATKIYTPSYISLETVLQQEGVIFQHYDTIFAVTYLSREIRVDKHIFCYHKLKNEILVNPAGLIQTKTHWIASKERAFLDRIYLTPHYYFDNLASMNWASCYELIAIYGKKVMEKQLNEYYKHRIHA